MSMKRGTAVSRNSDAPTVNPCLTENQRTEENMSDVKTPSVIAHTMAGIGVSSQPIPETPKTPTHRFGIPAIVTKKLGAVVGSESELPRLPETTPGPVPVEK